MYQTTHRFSLIDPSSISYQKGQSVTFGATPSVTDFMASSNCTFEQEDSVSDMGISYECSFKAAVSGRHQDLMRWSGRRAVIRLALSDGSFRYLGTKSDPVLLRVSPYCGADLISSEFSLPDPIDL